MLALKPKAIVATLIVTLGAAAAVVPAAHAASAVPSRVSAGTVTVAPHTPSILKARGSRPSTGKAQACIGLYRLYVEQIGQATQIDGNPDGGNNNDATAAEADKAANETKEAAQKTGCRWSS